MTARYQRRAILRAVDAGAALALPGVRAAASPPVWKPDWLARADATLTAAGKYLKADDGSGLYREHYPARGDDPRYADEWPFSQVHIGVLDPTSVPGAGPRYRPALEAHRAAQMRYWVERSATGLPGYASRVGPPHGSEATSTMTTTTGSRRRRCSTAFRKDAASLQLAKTIFALVSAAWDTDPDHPSPGGLFWTQQPGNGDRNTVSNMPAAQLALRLHEATGERRYLDAALCYYA